MENKRNRKEKREKKLRGTKMNKGKQKKETSNKTNKKFPSGEIEPAQKGPTLTGGGDRRIFQISLAKIQIRLR